MSLRSVFLALLIICIAVVREVHSIEFLDLFGWGSSSSSKNNNHNDDDDSSNKEKSKSSESKVQFLDLGEFFFPIP